MRIGIAALGRVSEDTGGKNYIVHFIRELLRLRPPHTFVLFLSEGESSKLGLNESEMFRIVTVPNSRQTPLHKVFGEQILLPRYIAREKIDVMYYPGNFVSLRSKVPSVVNVRSAAHFYGAEYGIRGIRRIIRSLLMPASARKARAVITPSDDIKQDIILHAKIADEKVHVIPHGVDLTLFDGGKNREAREGLELLERYGLTSGGYLLYVSALWRYKRQDQLLRAHAEIVRRGFSELKLVLAGMGTGVEQKYIEKLYALPKELGTERSVVFTGALPQTDLRYLYAHARAFVFPSSYESFGNPIFEAWASGIPVAVSNVHSFPEIAGDAALFFDPMDVKDMTDKILQLLSQPALAQTLVERGEERVKNFTWNAAVTRTLSLLETVRQETRNPNRLSLP
ncbi:MAG TPA: glycosyltransferase family 1 protein [Candidatus Kapabacteria bacterium]|nr:glycosyltransferase family 1 protein [Candidatus Kapabacteria bacterium]